MSIEALKNEIVNDPIPRGYSGMTDAEVAASVNVVDRTVADPVRKRTRDIVKAFGVAEGHALLIALQTAAASNLALAAILDACKDYSEEGGLDFSDAITIEAIDALVPAVLSVEQGAALKALGRKTISRAEELGIGKVAPGTVQQARLE